MVITFADLKRDCCEVFRTELQKSKQVNGASVAAHLQAAIKQDVANGMSLAEAHAKWKVPLKQAAEVIPPEIRYIISLYYKLMDCRTYGMNGINPLNLHDIECYERRYGIISEPILQILFELDDVYYSTKD